MAEVGRRTSIRAGLIAVALALSVGVGGAAPARPSTALYAEEIRVPLEGPGNASPSSLAATLYLPDGGGRFPLAVISHGAPRNPADRQRTRYYPDASRWFVERGFAVIVPMRRGYGASDGPYGESYGSCANPNYVAAGLAAAADIEATIRHMRQQPAIDPNRILLVGQSAGGHGSLAALSRAPPGVVGAINFAGGRGSKAPDDTCGPDRLVESMAVFGRSARLPSLWIYTANDRYFAPDLARAMFRAYVAAAAPAEFVDLPAFGDDGHMLFARGRGVAVWAPSVTRFLDTLRLPR